jgi:hypothetical protein
MSELLKNHEWQEGYAHSCKKDKDTYYLDFGGINMNTFESFSGYCYIRRAKEACMKGKWVAVPQNPFVEYHDTKVITGGSPSVVIKRVLMQITNWRNGKMLKDLEEWKDGKEPGEHKVQEQSTGEEDSLPFC